MRLLKVFFSFVFIASISSFAQAQQPACEWRWVGGGTGPDGSWTSVSVCLTTSTPPNVRAIAQRTTRSTGSCTIDYIASGYKNIRGCQDALIVVAPAAPPAPAPTPAPSSSCASGHTWTFQTGPGAGGDPQAAVKCGGSHCGFTVVPVQPVTYPLLRYTCR